MPRHNKVQKTNVNLGGNQKDDVVKDGNVVSLVKKFLKAGVIVKDKYEETAIGTPQGGQLFPLLSNIMLNLLDKKLEARKLHFIRYSDDTIILVKSEKAANRVMTSITKFIENNLKLKVDMTKTKVCRPSQMKYLLSHFRILQNAITKERLQTQNKKRTQRISFFLIVI